MYIWLMKYLLSFKFFILSLKSDKFFTYYILIQTIPISGGQRFGWEMAALSGSDGLILSVLFK